MLMRDHDTRKWRRSACGTFSLDLRSIRRGSHDLLMRTDTGVRTVWNDANGDWVFSLLIRLLRDRHAAFALWDAAEKRADDEQQS